MRRLQLLILSIACGVIGALLLTGCASDPGKRDAYMAGLADCGTTGLALAVGRGLAEQNPIGPVAACLLKPVAVEVSSRYDEPQRTANLQLTKAMWYGVTANNAASIVVVLAHATAPPLAPFTIGIATAYLIWRSGAEEREYAAICAGWKKDNPGFICEPYKKKE